MNSSGFFGILLFSRYLAEFSRILSDSLAFSRIISYSPGICPVSRVLSRIISDSSRFSTNLVGFSHILSYSFGILYVFFPRFSDLDFFRIMWYSFGLFAYSLWFGFTRFPSDSSGFCPILSSFSVFSWSSLNLSEFTQILSYSLEIEPDSYVKSGDFFRLFRSFAYPLGVCPNFRVI